MTLEDIAINKNKKPDSLRFEQRQKRRTTLADIISNLSYSIVVGTTVDVLSGLRMAGEIISSRVFNITCAGVTAKYYGKWRDYLYKATNTTEHDSTLARKLGIELLTFNTFNVPTYGAILFVSYLVSKFQIDYDTIQVAWHHAKDGMINTVLLSPLTSTSYGWYNNRIRRCLGVETPGEKVEHYTKNL